jgi:hypothetical protein
MNELSNLENEGSVHIDIATPTPRFMIPVPRSLLNAGFQNMFVANKG